MEKSRIESLDNYVSPYLREPLRSLDEVLRDRQTKRTTPPDSGPDSPHPPAAGHD